MSPQTMTEKDSYLQACEREHEITLRVLRAFPAGKLDLQPHPTSQTARDLMWMLALNKAAIEALIAGTLAQQSFPPAPQGRDELIATYEKIVKDHVAKVRAMTEEEFNAPVRIQSGKDSFMEARRGDGLWFMLMDTIHHRGQLSVYLRMSGAKVPSIYGPSRDEPRD